MPTPYSVSREIALSINELSDLTVHLDPAHRPAVESVVARLSMLFVRLDDHYQPVRPINPPEHLKGRFS